MSDFGDFVDDDALDTEPADPEQVAIKLHQLRRAARVARRVDRRDWDELDDDDREQLITIVAHLLAWLRRQGSG